MSDTPISDGGPAFPVKGMPIDPDTYLNRPGMTLRDYFAAAAMQGIISDPNNWSNSKKDMESVSHAAYEFADAMLKAKEAKP
jgi:hypothetical protein